VPVIDGLCLPGFAPLLPDLVARNAVGLVHHPAPIADAEAQVRDAQRRLLPALRKLIATSEATRTRLIEAFGVEASRIAVVAPGTDDLPRSTGSGGATCAILSVGALVPRKGHDVLLRALARLFDLDWHLTIAGDDRRDPETASGLVALAAELGITGRVTLAGEPDPVTLEALWRGADLFALATRWEGTGAAIAEALRRGLPVATTEAGAASVAVPPATGVVCPVDDVDQLSKAMRRLIFDLDLRREVAEAAWQAGQRLPSWVTQANAFVATLGC
jgi:glycosyltransferase involved in cell wall biosynthesis